MIRHNPYLNRSMIRSLPEFFGRTRELERVMARIGARTPQSVSVVGQRRMGKSSLLWHLAQQETCSRYLEDPSRYIFLLLDLQGQSHLDVGGFCRVFGERLGDAAGKRLPTPDVEDLSGLEDVIKRLAREDLRLICLFDEFETVTRNPAFDEELFGFLRSLANFYPIAFVTSSRRELQSLCHAREISQSPFFNIFSQVRLGPMTAREVEQLIAQPSDEAGLPLEPHTDEIVDMSGHLPFFAQIACSAAFEILSENGEDVLDVGAVNRRFMEEAGSHFSYIWQHLSDDERVAFGALGQNPSASLGKALVDDGFLREAGGTFEPFSRCFADYLRDHRLLVRISEQSYHPFRSKVTTDFGAKLPPVSV